MGELDENPTESRWPRGEWIRDGHTVCMLSDDDAEGAPWSVFLSHPDDCPHEDHGDVVIADITIVRREYKCPPYYEHISVNLEMPPAQEYSSVNWDQDIPEERWMEFARAHEGVEVEIEYYYWAGWAPSTPEYPSEYEWTFTWRPVELGEAHGS